MSSNPVNNFFRVSAEDFKKIPGSPIAYWASDRVREVFVKGDVLKNYGDTRQGMATSDNNRFLRFWWEVSFNTSYLNASSREEAAVIAKKWFPYNKGGDFRKWYGNNEIFVDWENDGEKVINYAASLYGSPTRTIKSISEYFKECISWSKISSANLAMRYYPEGYIFDVAGCSIFSDSKENLIYLLGYANTIMVRTLLKGISPTLNFEAGHIASLPIISISKKNTILDIVKKLIEKEKSDWNSYETSWDFTYLPLLHSDFKNPIIETSYKNLREHWREITMEMKRLEEENNRIFIEAYDLQDELTPEVPLKEITLTCNPYYRYGDSKSEEELEKLLLLDTIKEYICYAVGCIFGRYSLDVDGLVLANEGEGVEEYVKQVPEPSFMPDESGILPITEEDDFSDDLPSQFRNFLRVSFGEENFQENLRYIEDVLGKSIRDYLRNNFYNDHVKRYKKRPIYWMITSPSGALKALIYLHRYTKDTVNVFLNDYLRPFEHKIDYKIKGLSQVLVSASSSGSEKTKAQKQIDKLNKVETELENWERDVVYDLAVKRIELDLDDGVKVNYGKLGSILETVKGLNG